MKILALDSSGLVASVAVMEDDNLLGEYTINHKKTHSQTLLPMLDEVAKMIELDLSSVDVIAVSAGPGSFTGLRIGSATAKGLALALDRHQTYTGLDTFVDEKMQMLLPQCVVQIEEIVEKVNEMGRPVVFLGDGVLVFRDFIAEHCNVPYQYAPAHCNKQRAAAVAALGAILYEEGKAENAADHKPDYLRLSQAERERQEKARDFRI